MKLQPTTTTTTYRVAVLWTMEAIVEVEAASLDAAVALAEADTSPGLPPGSVIDGSYIVVEDRDVQAELNPADPSDLILSNPDFRLVPFA